VTIKEQNGKHIHTWEISKKGKSKEPIQSSHQRDHKCWSFTPLTNHESQKRHTFPQLLNKV